MEKKNVWINVNDRLPDYAASRAAGGERMKREAWYRFTFEDGAYVIALGLNANQAHDLMERHGKFTNKEFVCWVGEMTNAQLLDMLTGGDKNVSTIH